jgi:hypothetical protein
LSEEEEQIRILVRKATLDDSVPLQLLAIDALASYGKEAIPGLFEILEAAVETSVKEHALETITRLREHRSGTE